MRPSPVFPRLAAAALVALAALSLLAVACGSGERERVEGLARVRIGDLVIDAEVPPMEAFGKGLGGRDSLARDRGMLFVFPQVGTHAFWMKDMRFAIDIIWISEDKRVVHLQADAPAPAPDAPDSSLPVYMPGTGAKYVLEVNAGLAAEKGVRVGDTAEIELP